MVYLLKGSHCTSFWQKNLAVVSTRCFSHHQGKSEVCGSCLEHLVESSGRFFVKKLVQWNPFNMVQPAERLSSTTCGSLVKQAMQVTQYELWRIIYTHFLDGLHQLYDNKLFQLNIVPILALGLYIHKAFWHLSTIRIWFQTFLQFFGMYWINEHMHFIINI